MASTKLRGSYFIRKVYHISTVGTLVLVLNNDIVSILLPLY